MAYKINDLVQYGLDGVCKITDITKKDFRGKKIKYYVLNPVFDNKTEVNVPYDNEELVSRMRKVLTRKDLLKYVPELPPRFCKWIDSETERKADFSAALYSGDMKEIVRLVKTIYLHESKIKDGKRLSDSDNKFFRDIFRILFDEVSLALKVPRENVFAELKTIIKK